MKKTVLILSSLPVDLIEKLKTDFQVGVIDDGRDDFLSLYEKHLPQAHGLIGFGYPFSAKHLEMGKRLEAVATVSVGYDRFDLEALQLRNICLTNTPDVLTETTADLGFALMVSAGRRIVELSDQIKNGEWTHASDDLYGFDIHGKTLGIVGFGRIGQAVAKRGSFGFGMPILYYNRTEKVEAQKLNAKKVSLNELFAESDYVCVVIPLTKETENLVGAPQFALMKKNSIFVNIARGKVVDETALIQALQSQAIRGAGLDVFQKEPLPMDSPLLKLKNVVLTPHVGSATEETRYAMAKLAVENLSLALQGKTPPNRVC